LTNVNLEVFLSYRFPQWVKPIEGVGPSHGGVGSTLQPAAIPPAARALAPSLKQRGEESKSRKRKIEKAKLEIRNGGDR
jgi:hypothetical protein